MNAHQIACIAMLALFIVGGQFTPSPELALTYTIGSIASIILFTLGYLID